MVAKSILQIDVQDESFKKFTESYNAYYASLGKMPGAWAAGGKAMAAAMMAQTKALKEQAAAEAEARAKAIEETKRLKYESEATARAWQDMGRHTVAFARNIASVTTSLLKWSTMTSIFAGLLGVGGLFGLDRLAYGAAGARRSAQGLGVSIGEQKAFGLAYGSVVDPSKLNELQAAQFDLSKRGAFGAMGINNPESMDVADLAVRMMERARQIYRPGMSDQQLNATGVGQFFTREELNRLNRANMGELSGQYRGEIGRLGYSDETAKRWQDFMKQLQDAGGVIERIFVEDLGVLAPQFKELSKGLVDVVAALGDSPKVKQWLEELAGALEKLATWLGGAPKAMAESGTPDTGPSFLELLRRKVFEPTDAVSPKLLASIGMTESGGNPYAVSKKGAMGLFQFMPDTWAQYGHGSPFDPVESANAAKLFVAHLMSKFNNDVEKVLAAYNWGEGNVEKDINTYGRAWKKHLPQETASYINNVLARDQSSISGRMSDVTIRVENNTGGNAVVNARQAAAVSGQ